MKIAIRGHKSRGKEVIQILKNLGGKTIFTIYGFDEQCYYFINPNGIIIESLITIGTKDKFSLYTIEEFEKEFPFKIGDEVFHKALKDYFEIIKFDPSYDYPYQIKGKEVFNCKSEALEFYKEMKTRTINLSLDKAKEWYKKGGELKEIALQAFTEKELNPLPRSWEEFCRNNSVQVGECWLENCDVIHEKELSKNEPRIYKNWIPSKESAEAHLAMIQLEQLRNCWRQGWIPSKGDSGFGIRFDFYEGFRIVKFSSFLAFLSFPTEEIAKEFLECFKELIEKAGDLI